MLKRLLRVLLSIVVVIGIAYFLLIDHVLKTLIETQGTKALLARLDVGKVVFHLLPTSIRLEAVQVTNAQEPTRNLVEFAALETPLQLGALLDRNVDIPELHIQGLRFDTNRAKTGAVPGLTPLPGAADSTSEMPDTAQVALQQQQRLRDEVNRTHQDMAALLAKWQQRLQQLPDDARVADYQARAMTLRSANKTAELAQLKQQIGSELERAKQWKEEFELDLQNARAQLAYAQSAPQSGGSGGATPEAMNAVVGAMLGAEFKPLLDATARRLDTLVRQQSADGNAPLALLIRHAIVDGQLDFGNQPLLFAGTVDNLTLQPRQWNVATDFDLAGVPAQPSQFSARGRADFRKTPRIDMRFDLRQFPLRNFPLSKNPQLSLSVDNANADMQGLLSSTGNQFDLNLLGRFQQAALGVQASTDSASQALKAALQDIREFDVNVQMSGAMQQPTLKFDSSLTPRLAAALSQQLQSGAAVAQANPELRQQLSGVQQVANDFETLRQQLLARQSALQNIVAN